jgi:hypothetical protein
LQTSSASAVALDCGETEVMTSGSTGVAAPVLSLGAVHAQIRGGVADAEIVTVSARQAATQRMQSHYTSSGAFQGAV